MSLWEALADSFLAVLVVVLSYVVALAVRRRFLARSGGVFELSLRVRPHHGQLGGRGWVLGVGRYSGAGLEWFRFFSLSLRPTRVFARSELAVESRRDPGRLEVHTLHRDHVVARMLTADGPLEVALSPQALTGFLAWLEAAPPGQAMRSV